MGWVHGHKRHGALLALAALALQIVLSFGHVHLDGVRPANAHSTVAVAHKPAVAQASRQGPAQNPGADDDYCAICASIYLASTSLIADAPPLPVPLGFHRIEHSYGAARDIAAPRRFAFQSRGPPAA
jgi:hypothetical protein